MVFNMSFKISFNIILKAPQETADLVTFPEEILNGKLHFLCNADTLEANNIPLILGMKYNKFYSGCSAASIL